jgi:NAD-dependent dihydropyrimidine dehydrogenase PreA subunit
MEAYAGIPRERIAWYPMIDAAQCHPERCELNCLSWCQKGVYQKTADGRVIVAQPFACTVGDISCSVQCPLDAISFPSQRDLRRMLKEARQELGPS